MPPLDPYLEIENELAAPVEEDDPYLAIEDEFAASRVVPPGPSPSVAAQQHRLSRDTGIPVGVVRDAEQEIRDRQARNIPWDVIDKETPVLGRNLRDPELGPAIIDNVQGLQFSEKWAAQTEAGTLAETFGNAATNIPYRWLQVPGGMMMAVGESEVKSPAAFWEELKQDATEAATKGPLAFFANQFRAQFKALSYAITGKAFEAGMAEILTDEQLKDVEVFKDQLAESGRLLWEEAEHRIDPIPREVMMTVWGYEVSNPSWYLATALEAGVGTMAPGFVVGYLTKNPDLALGVMGAQVYGQQYGRSRSEGRSPSEAHMDAVFYAASEVVTEIIPMGIFLRKSKGGKEFIRKVTSGLLSEGGQEILNEGMQKLILHI